MSEDGRSSAAQRASLVDQAIDHITVVEHADGAALDAMAVVLARCEALGVPDVTLAEVVRSWTTIIG